MKNLTNRIVGSLTVLSLAMGAVMTAQGSISFTDNGGGDYTANPGTLSQVIPDNDPSGVAYGLNFGYSGLSVANVTVTLDISGGNNGDLYAYLSNGSTTLVLLNRVGTSGTSPYGYADAGFNNVTLSDSGTVSIHNYGGNGGSALNGGTYAPDSGVTFSSAFGGTDPSANSGNWTLFLADESGGSVSTLTGFNVDITADAVPEPVNMALGIFGGLVGVVGVARSLKKAKTVKTES